MIADAPDAACGTFAPYKELSTDIGFIEETPGRQPYDKE